VTLKVLNHIDPEPDIQFTLGPVDFLDHASRLPNYGSKMGIDATRSPGTSPADLHEGSVLPEWAGSLTPSVIGDRPSHPI